MHNNRELIICVHRAETAQMCLECGQAEMEDPAWPTDSQSSGSMLLPCCTLANADAESTPAQHPVPTHRTEVLIYYRSTASREERACTFACALAVRARRMRRDRKLRVLALMLRMSDC